MKYKELIDNYKKGLASEEEKIILEQEIEKYEAIQEYISDEFDVTLRDLTESSDIEQQQDTINLIKSVNSRLRKVVFTSVGIVIALIIGIFFIMSPLIDNLYYNPTKISVGSTNKDIDFDIAAYSELNMPGYSLSSNVGVEKLGFGEYNISFFRTNLFTQEVHPITTKIKRGNKLTDSSEIIWHNNFDFMSVRYPSGMSSESVNEQKKRVMEHIMQLNSVSYLSSNLIFEKDLTMQELHELELKYPDTEFIWAGIRTIPHNDTRRDLIGIQLVSNNSVMITDDLIEKKYPAFHILEWLVNPNGYDSNEMSQEAKAYELHYKSLLQYMIDRKEATDIFDYPNRILYYKSALEYAEEHGVKTYGVLVYANAQDLIYLLENESIKTLELNEVMASKKYIK
jgi:hypothetical protein